MIYRCCRPSAHLQEFIRDFLLIHFDFRNLEAAPVKPYPACPKQGIIFYIKGTVVSSTPETGISEKRAPTVIFGQPTTRQNLHLPKDYLAISVRFQPGALFKFLGLPMTEFLQRNVDAELLFGQEARLLHERLANTPSYGEMLALIEGFLWGRIQKLKNIRHPVDKIGQLLFENPQAFTLDAMAKEACLSASQLERRFLQQIGVPPKLYARICRFHQAYLMKQRNPDLTWLEVAWESGYSDYQHLAKDFKAFSNGTPNELIQEDAGAPEQRLLLNPNFKYV
ncbi:helix-turn-helix domain-containing protein [Rufibacter hautae]|uniref:AraC family transcriptional regulator n=1 Tax=Rufibacter hautae TaxID=2595005 RepID=A0A5B6THF9_9BACT|nr:helix-turn-helix domain-containing protein [Rufibacter hautae]KAA3438692.1 AraC family transcriptional regulator [Rufibacter hautae]